MYQQYLSQCQIYLLSEVTVSRSIENMYLHINSFLATIQIVVILVNYLQTS